MSVTPHGPPGDAGLLVAEWRPEELAELPRPQTCEELGVNMSPNWVFKTPVDDYLVPN